MSNRNIKLNNPDRFRGDCFIAVEKFQHAIKKACDKLASKIDIYMDAFPRFDYSLGINNSWICGMHTGTFLLAYELTGDEKFLNVVRHHMLSYRKRIDEKINLDDHDVGFVFSPSTVAYYKVTGDEEAKQISYAAAKHLYETGYSKKGGFILRSGPNADKEWACRTMMDSLLNAPLLFWAGKEFNIPEYTDAGLAQSAITDKCLIRDDGSSFHHYQFEVGTHKPVRGLTLQGASNDSCWSRGHSWGVLGLPIAYSYTGAEWILPLHRDITYYMLNHLPEDNIPYWDFDFVSGSEPRDASAAVISVCGMLEAIAYLPDTAPEKEVYKNAAIRIMESVIDNCTDVSSDEYDGLINHVTFAKPQGKGIDSCAIYGDYFYLESLIRFTNPNWKRYW